MNTLARMEGTDITVLANLQDSAPLDVQAREVVARACARHPPLRCRLFPKAPPHRPAMRMRAKGKR